MKRKLKLVFSFVMASVVVIGLSFAAIHQFGNIWVNLIFFVVVIFISTVLYYFWLDKFDIFSMEHASVMDRGISRPDIASVIENTIMDYAKEKILMFHGALSSIFFDNSRIIKALKGEKGRKIDIRIVCGPELKIENHEFFKLVKDGKVLLYLLRETDTTGETGKFHHFVCVDNKHAWLEYHHGLDECSGGREWINEPIIAGRCMSKFNKLAKKSKVVSTNNVMASIGQNNFVMKYDHSKNEWIKATHSELTELARKIGEEI